MLEGMNVCICTTCEQFTAKGETNEMQGYLININEAIPLRDKPGSGLARSVRSVLEFSGWTNWAGINVYSNQGVAIQLSRFKQRATLFNTKHDADAVFQCRFAKKVA